MYFYYIVGRFFKDFVFLFSLILVHFFIVLFDMTVNNEYQYLPAIYKYKPINTSI